jgi:hypothetical protein
MRPDSVDQVEPENHDVAAEHHHNSDARGDHRCNRHHRLGAKIGEKHPETSYRIVLTDSKEFDPCPDGSNFIPME